MKKKNFKSLIALGFASTLVLAACGGATDDAETDTSAGVDTTEETGGAAEDFSIVMVTDFGGVDDKSFNQSAWEGMEEWGTEHGKSEGTDGYSHIVSQDESQFVTNLNTALQNDFDLIYGIGFALQPAMSDVASQNPDQNFVIIDEQIDAENVASVLFKDQEAAFLAGVSAAHTTETGRVGFIGGMESDVISRFEAGFRAGVAAVDPEIIVDVTYVGSFDNEGLGRSTAATMYSNGADIIYHAAGAVGNGVFGEAIDRMNAGSDQDLWVIGVDRDQEEEGVYNDGNLTLTSTVKGVGAAVVDVTNQSMEGNFPGGQVTNYGLAEDAVGVTRGSLSDEAWAAVEDFKQQIIDGDLVVPEDPSELEE